MFTAIALYFWLYHEPRRMEIEPRETPRAWYLKEPVRG